MLLKKLISSFLLSVTTLASLSVVRARSHPDVRVLLNITQADKQDHIASTPTELFNTILIALILAAIAFEVYERCNHSEPTPNPTSVKQKPSNTVKNLQMRFLLVFYILRAADWLCGPYFYDLYASKVPPSYISKIFVVGFASAALFGPLAGRAADEWGRKKATLAFCILYALSAASTRSSALAILFAGRVLGGVGASLMFSAPEAWLVAESQKAEHDPDDTWLGEAFGLAYAGDSIVAILAGQLSAVAAMKRGPTGPFELSILILIIGGILITLLWGENVAESSKDDTKPSIMEAVNVIRKDPRIALVGAAQSLFEASMYIFIMQWPPTVSHAIETAFESKNVVTPYGTILSCFMACYFVGAAFFRHLARFGIATEESTASMLTIAALSMGSATKVASSAEAPLASLIVSFFAFEACVGLYFPSTGSLRSKYVPDAHRSIIMNLFGIPLNVLVVTVFLLNERLGVSGSLGVATGALNLSAICMYKLHSMTRPSSPSISKYK